jgi:hypothetical protein
MVTALGVGCHKLGHGFDFLDLRLQVAEKHWPGGSAAAFMNFGRVRHLNARAAAGNIGPMQTEPWSRDRSEGYRMARDDYDSDGSRPVSAIRGCPDVRARSEKQQQDTAEAWHLPPRQQVFLDAAQTKVSDFVADLTRVELSTPERHGALNGINAKIDLARDRLAAMEDTGRAAEALYLSLDDGRKAIADRRLPETMPGHCMGAGCSSEDDHQNDPIRRGRHRRGQ